MTSNGTTGSNVFSSKSCGRNRYAHVCIYDRRLLKGDDQCSIADIHGIGITITTRRIAFLTDIYYSTFAAMCYIPFLSGEMLFISCRETRTKNGTVIPTR